MGARVVLSSKAHAVPVTVMNNGEYLVYLYAGTRVGEISPIKAENRTTVHQTGSKQSENHVSEKVGPVNVDFDECDVAPLKQNELKKLLNEYRDVPANNEKEVCVLTAPNLKLTPRTMYP